MARYVQRKCPKCSPEDTTSCQIVNRSGATYMLKCGECRHVFEAKAPSERHLGQFKYPHYCASTDQTFQTRDEEKAYVKANGLEVAD